MTDQEWAASNRIRYGGREADRVVRLAAMLHGYTEADLVGPQQAKTLCAARHVAMYVIRSRLGHSYTELGQLFGGRDHTSVMHACRKVAGQVADGGPLAEAVALIGSRLDSGEAA